MIYIKNLNELYLFAHHIQDNIDHLVTGPVICVGHVSKLNYAINVNCNIDTVTRIRVSDRAIEFNPIIAKEFSRHTIIIVILWSFMRVDYGYGTAGDIECDMHALDTALPHFTDFNTTVYIEELEKLCNVKGNNTVRILAIKTYLENRTT